ncbi:anthranilate synthase [Arachidicoccus ginsenosidimutans]|uniref:anthranilate synthase component I family protein n=1 Tax=Arachidicoccus sp. BS20 TaxID=1850526 RepID=UPI0007F1094D|nr:anthranilate synthase component I family protein [Arachidicoccus sp. BS20]ANI88182.1 anthranilate synthase [Arachidicoccus sp. BS20]
MVKIETTYKKVLSDIYTPVGIYLRLRDKFRDTVLLESAEYGSSENSRSIIGINAIGGIEVKNLGAIELKYPNRKPEKQEVRSHLEVPDLLWNYMQQYDVQPADNKLVKLAQGLFGYVSYNAVQFFDTIKINHANNEPEREIPLMRYRLYQYVIVINHFKSEMFICENKINGLDSELDLVETLINNKDVPSFPFALQGKESSNKTDDEYIEMVQKGIKSCLRGDVFQIVLSRRFQQKFTGDDFNVYRTLRSINPSPYLFYFDYGDYKLLGSSPESQLIVRDGKSIVHPIAGTYKKTGNEIEDEKAGEALLQDPKEIAEHTMLVDLARNDLSRNCENVHLNYYKQIHAFSHVLHIVSEVSGDVKENANPFVLLANTFPAGTLSGAPKYKAMQLIDEYEKDSRSYYAGTIGFVGFDGSFNHAIMIRSFLSKNNTLYYQAGAGIVAKSNPQSELQEVHNKLGALKQALVQAQSINNY